MEIVKITNCSGSLGDCVSITALFKKRKGKIVFLRNPVTENILSKVYDGVAEVEFSDKPQNCCPETNEELCYSQRILNAFGVTDCNAIPELKVTDEEKQWAAEFLSKYKNPVAFNNSVGRPNDHELGRYRELPDDLSQYLVDEQIKQEKTVLQFGLSKNYRPVKGTIPILDLGIRELIGCYAVIGEFIGCDSGDYHVMTSVGGRAKVFVPPSTWHYNHKRHLYLDYAWCGQEKNVEYFVFCK